jgi:DNA polymerase-3 subunit gamma/tau
MLNVLGTLSADLKNTTNARLALEVALTRMLYPESENSLNALAARVATLEARLEGGQRDGSRVLSAEQGGEDLSFEKDRTREPSLCPPSGDEAIQTPAENIARTPVSPEKADEGPAFSKPSAPTPTPTPTQTAEPEQPSSPDLNDQSLHRIWNATVDSLKKKRPSVAANLGGIAPRLSKEGNRLVLELPATAATSKQYLETDANQKLLSQAIEQTFGKPLEVKLVLAEGKGARPAPAPATAFTAAAATAPAPSSGSSYQEQRPSPLPAEPATTAPLFGGEQQLNNAEPSKEELESILSNSLNATIQFKEE